MRKTLLLVVVFSFVLWSASFAEAWVGKTLSLILLIIGVLLYGTGFVLFCFRFFRWLQVLKTRQIDLSGLNFFRRIEETRPYQREAWLQATLVFLIPLAVSIPLSFFQRNMDANVVLAIYLVWPLSLLLYAALSTNFERLAAS